MDGIFAVYKPKGMTSHDVVDRVRRITGERSVGHAGTLDPLAEGVLVLGIGDATKDLQKVVEKDKEYFVRIKLGEESTTDDAEGEKRMVFAREIPTSDKIAALVEKFKGKIKQTPPLYSAVKVEGKESYKWARRGEPKELKPREVEIKDIEVIMYDWPNLSLKVVTGPGFYVRSLARDIGKELKTGGYVQELFRTRVGVYTDKEAIRLEEFPEFWKSRTLS
ncbi:MAG: tRNA pseudouridine synthase B [Candidatus Jorgensenbacteria bacterium GW2011_GWA1_48_13]|uniref:tRNA pseudouridine synthase B n=1 Tax=Candidatus Jorgensenbacteria bacterium GW2011_GWB1_50_10 TaxID=1618665 RepID=A0A0G1W9W0_9BACT|nr:MAG: tRNA pseudouridine synthase B [Candidatus Jorgensenbacteria bacterium GW2011_GWA1_48_13]KKW15390.1 MAG: tRNA pseudouridine synthase B [Candidatus Jorgensenbacteria bacterium GW2011_GWB1_50_10]